MEMAMMINQKLARIKKATTKIKTCGTRSKTRPGSMAWAWDSAGLGGLMPSIRMVIAIAKMPSTIVSNRLIEIWYSIFSDSPLIISHRVIPFCRYNFPP